MTQEINKESEIIIIKLINEFINQGLIPEVQDICSNLKVLSIEWFYANNNKELVKELIKQQLTNKL